MPTAEELTQELRKQLRNMQLNTADDAAKSELQRKFEQEDLQDLRVRTNEALKKEKAEELATRLGVDVNELLKHDIPEEMIEAAYELALEKTKAPPEDKKDDNPEDKKDEPKVKTTQVTGGGPEPIDYTKYRGKTDSLARLWTDLDKSGQYFNTEIINKE